jgi:Endodeoxyribonuclease RusA.
MKQSRVRKQEAQPLSQDGVRLCIKGRVPSKKNSRVCFVRGGKMMNIPSKKYTEWHKDAIAQLASYDRGLLEDIVKVTLSIWAPDKRASDLTNKAESIMDLLVDHKIIADDNWWLVSKIELIFMGVDRPNPRCEVYIETKSNAQSL